MANKDVIERADGRIARCRCRRTDEQCYDCRLFAGLAAALREAREGRDDILGVLRFAVKNARIFPKDAVEFAQSVLDAAMKTPGGEGE